MSMLKVADIWYCSFDELVRECSVYSQTIKNGMQRGSYQWQAIADPNDRRKRLIRYDTMADKYKAIVRGVLCSGFEPEEFAVQKKNEVLSERSLVNRLELACRDGFRTYISHYPLNSSDQTYRKNTQMALARAAIIIETIGTYILEKRMSWRDYAPYEQTIEWLKPDYDQYFPLGHRYLPMEVKNLKERVLMRFIGKKETGKERQQSPMPIAEVIHLPRQGNKNRDVFSDDQELFSWILQARMNGKNWTDSQIVRLVQGAREVNGLPVPSDTWIVKQLQSPKIQQLSIGRWGNEGGRAAIYQHYNSFKPAMYAGDCWQVDATRINFVEHKTFDGKGTQFLFIVAIRDVYSGDIVGVDFGITENRWTYINAFKMAATVTGHLPYKLVHDRFPGHLTDEMEAVMERIREKGVEVKCTHNAQGKAAIERWFDTLQTVFLSQSRYYYGQGIRSTRPSAHRSPQYLDKLRREARKEGFDFDKSWQEAWRCVEVYRNTKLSDYSKKHKNIQLTPAQLYEQSEKPNVRPLQSWSIAEMFWLETEVTVLRNQIKFTVDNHDYIYQIFDKDFLYTYTKKKVSVRYDDTDLDKVMLFMPGTDNFLIELQETKLLAIHGPNADGAELGRRKAQVKRFEAEKQADRDQALNGTQDISLLLGSRTNKAESIPAESAHTKAIYRSMGATIIAKKNRQNGTVKPKSYIPPKAHIINASQVDEMDSLDPNLLVRY